MLSSVWDATDISHYEAILSAANQLPVSQDTRYKGCVACRLMYDSSACHGCTTVQTFREAQKVVFYSLWSWVISKKLRVSVS